MARLRVRIELNRSGGGVPLHKLASVAQESERFLRMLGQDVQIKGDRGEWLAFDFDHESLNFTAEYIGPVSQEQVRAFFSAFDGVTSLRRTTIAQFARIADAIDEDELIGFGLYASGHEPEPSEWRCLSRRDAFRISEEIQLLMGASGELEQETHLPVVMDSGRGARLFRERHERKGPSSEQFKLPNFIRDVEANLSNRICHLENEVQSHSQQIGDLRENSTTVEQSVRTLLTTVESFCGTATRELERHSAPQLTAPMRVTKMTRKRKAVIACAVVVAGAISSLLLLWPRTTEPLTTGSKVAEATETAKPAATADPAIPEATSSKPNPIAKQFTKPVAKQFVESRAEKSSEPGTEATLTQAENSDSEIMHIELQARDPCWVSITNVEGKHLFIGVLQANESRSLDLTTGAVLRTGNAGGLEVRFNGKDIGELGPSGKIRDVEFQNGSFKILPPVGG